MKSNPESRTWPKTIQGGNSAAETIGTSLFVCLLFSAAISEALNNLLIVLLFIWWLATRSAVRELRAAPPHLLIIVMFCTIPLISLMTSTVGEPYDRLGHVTGAVKFALLLLPVYSMSSRNRLSVDLVTACLTAGALIASVEAFVTWHYSSGYSPILKALAGINESAMYMSVILAVAIALSWSPKLPVAILGYTGIIAALCLSFISDCITALAVSACVVFLAVVMSGLIGKRKVFVSVIACFMVLSGIALTATNAHYYWNRTAYEFTSQIWGDNIGDHRLEIFNTAVEVYDRNFWFGAGFRQFQKATSVEIVADELDTDGRRYEEERSKFYHDGRGHNVWTEVLVERGLMGVGLLLSFFLVTAFQICRSVFVLYRGSERGLEMVQLAFISSSVWIMLFVGGVGISTFHTEHGMVALLLLVWSLTVSEVSIKRMSK